jgi:hypothetical protein
MAAASPFCLSRLRAPLQTCLATGVASLLIFAPSAALEAAPRKKATKPAAQKTPAAPALPISQEPLPKAPGQFNPDPGGGAGPTPGVAPEAPPLLFAEEPVLPPAFGTEPLPVPLQLPRKKVRSREEPEKVWHSQEYPLAARGEGLLPHSRPVPNRWLLNFPAWTRYRDPANETPYQYETPHLWHPYRQSTLKGDVPIVGQDIFANITAKNFSLFEFRKLPVPSGSSTATAGSFDFYGRSQQFLFANDTSIAVDLFKGETSFKPVEWLVRFQGVYNTNWIRVRENNLIDPDPRGTNFRENNRPPPSRRIEALPASGSDYGPAAGQPVNFTQTINPGDAFNFIAPQLKPLEGANNLVPVDASTNEAAPKAKPTPSKSRRKDFAGTRYTVRQRDFFALQEAFGELHIKDLSDNYDFISSRWGLQPFISDFRGFIFADTNLGARIFGNWDNNRTQYNLAYFNQREKDTYSDLNTFNSRNQQVLIANVFRQDALWKGYTAQLSLHGNFDSGNTHYDKNGFLVRPQPLGTVRPGGDFRGSRGDVREHDVNTVYFGWAGDGHIGRLNLSHAFYQVLGEDEANGLAGRRIDVNAQMAALELSYDRDWIRFKFSGFYASGDDDPTDRTGRGFDTILDSPSFIGGPFSWYVHENPNLGGTGVNLKQRDSLVPNLRTSKTQGQSNFVNPGVMILGAGSDLDVTPKLKAFANLNHIWLSQTEPVELALHTNKARSDLGWDTSVGLKYRPLLTDNIVISAGIGFFFPGGGYRDIYRRNTERVAGLGPQDQEGKVDRALYNAFMTLSLIY